MNLARLRHFLNMTVWDVSAETNVPVYLIQRFERGERMSPHVYAVLADYYGIGPEGNNKYDNNALYAARKRHKFSQDEWADILYTSREKVSRIENGTTSGVAEARIAYKAGYLSHEDFQHIVQTWVVRECQKHASIAAAYVEEVLDEEKAQSRREAVRKRTDGHIRGGKAQ